MRKVTDCVIDAERCLVDEQREAQNNEPQALASVNGYAAWRAAAEIRLAELESAYWKHRHAGTKLATEINDLRHVMGNGASGGTAWTLYNIQALRPADEK